MSVCNRNNFLRITIILIITTFSKEISVQRTRRVREDIYQTKPNAENEPAYMEHEYYHRNDIGHLNEYYQERMKLREEYNAIQKAIEETKFQNNTVPKDVRRKFFDVTHSMESGVPTNTSSFDTFHALKPEVEDINHVSPAIGLNLNGTKLNFNSTTAINNTELLFQNKSYVKIGNCEGLVFYRQNIVVKVPNYDAINGYLVDVNLEGICITCVEVISENGEDVKVTLTSGGPGKRNTSLRFEGFDKDIKLSYVLKVWGVGGDC